MKKILFVLMVVTGSFISISQAHGQVTDFSELTLTKSFKGESVETTKSFSVEADYAALKMELHGTAKAGKIIVSITKPNGEKLKSLEIDAASDVMFEQTFNLEENKDLAGDWQLKIKTDNAQGMYHLEVYTSKKNPLIRYPR